MNYLKPCPLCGKESVNSKGSLAFETKEGNLVLYPKFFCLNCKEEVTPRNDTNKIIRIHYGVHPGTCTSISEFNKKYLS